MKKLRRSTITVRKFDINYTRENFMKASRDIFNEAAIDFVQTAAPMFPSLTGQAKAAVVNIAKSLGLETGFNAFSPPISEWENQQVSLWLSGNTPDRGETMGNSEIQEYKNSVAWTINLDITAAHNGFAYFTYWDNVTWHSLDDAIKSAEELIRRKLRTTVKLKVYKYGRRV